MWYIIYAWGNIQLIHGFFSIRFGNFLRFSFFLNFRTVIYRIAYVHYYYYRTPFELNTTVRCATVALFELYYSSYVYVFYYSIICLLIEVTTYTKTFMHDIKGIFDQLDKLSKCKNSELAMLKYCKDAVDFHERVYR